MNGYRLLLLVYPRAFRARFGRDLEELFLDLYASQAAGRPWRVRAAFWCRMASDAVRQGLSERFGRHRHRLPLHVHHVRSTSVMTLLFEDVRHAWRALRRQRGVALVILATLALAIGANSAIFTVVNTVLLRPLPFERPEKVVMIFERDPRGGQTTVSVPTFEDWRQTLASFEALSLVTWQSVNLTGVSEPDRLRGGFVSADFFRVLGVQPVLGRAFLEGEDHPGATKTALLTHGAWQNRFGGSPDVIGQALMLNNEPHEVIGVLPRAFEFPMDAADVWMPFSSVPFWEDVRNSRNDRAAWAVGRIRDGVSLEEAAVELRHAAADLAREHPESHAGWSADLEAFHEVAVRSVGRNLRLLSGALLFVLLIACANIANLLLARASGRQREMAVRAALGATRGRLLRQLLVESAMLAVAGGTLGLLLGAALTDGMLALVTNLPRADRVGPDMTVVGFTGALSILTGLAFGIVPALRTSRPDLRSSLAQTTRAGESRTTGRIRAGLVVAEIALSLMLLVGAGLLGQSLYKVLTVDVGYRPENLLTLEYRLPRNKYSSGAQQWEFHRQLLERVGQVPGVERAALARAIPQSGNGGWTGFWDASKPRPPQEAMPRAQFNTVTASYFQTMGIPVISGRVCDDRDTPDAQMGVMVNRFLAGRLWPQGQAIGQRLLTPDAPVEAVVLGVVGDTRPQRLHQPVSGQIYGCLSQDAGVFASLVARTTGEPMALARAVREAVWSVDPDQPVWKIRSAESMIAGSVQGQRFLMLLMAFAAGLALLLAGVGTFSVLSYNVQRRAREVGLRLALGASRGGIARLVLGQTARLTLVGVAAGLAGAWAVSRIVAGQLYEITPRDPLTFAAAAGTLILVALFAAWIPLRRATAVDPMVTLRAD